MPPAESGSPAGLTGEARALHDRFTRMLGEPCAFLMRVAPPQTRDTDAPMVIDSLRRLDDTVIHQPPLAAQRALGVARDPASSVLRLAAIFEQDPAMTRALLVMANSAYYQLGNTPCLSIPEAVQRVGIRGVESIVTTTMVEGLLCRPGNAYASMLAEVWAHMTRTAPIARDIAPCFGVVPEVAFTVGLLHDMGKLIIFDHISRLRTRLHREVVVPDRFLLNMLNWLHEPLGGIAALRWNLGTPVARAIAWHHRQPLPETVEPLSELICLAEQVDHSLRLHTPLDLHAIAQHHGLTVDLTSVRERLTELSNATFFDRGGGPAPSRAA